MRCRLLCSQGQQHVLSSSLLRLFFLSQILFFPINLVLLQRTQEDESNSTLFEIADLHMLQGMGSKIKIRKFIMYETCNIVGVSDTLGNINYSFLQLNFLLYIIIIAFSCFIKNLIISLQNLFLVGDPFVLYKYYPQDCVHSSYYVVWLSRIKVSFHVGHLPTIF